MKIYVLDSGKYEKEFMDMINGLRCISTQEELLANEFTNYSEPHICLYKNISGKDRYEISFSIILSSKTLNILEINVLDESFGQPHFVNREYNERIKKIIDNLIEKKLFSYTS